MGLKIYTANSARGFTCQIQRIEQGFIDLGHEIVWTPEQADLVYQNNAWFDQIITDKRQGSFKKSAKLIFNILDICPHCTDFPMRKLREQIKEADAVTVISETVREDCYNRLNGNCDYEVIYNPQMPVFAQFVPKKHPYKFLIVGRANDGNKRISLAIEALQWLGVPEEIVGVVGSEYPGWGSRLGVVTNEYLNELYNSADFLLMPSKNEGIGLGAIEAAGCGVIPVICNDLSTREEFFPRHLFNEYDRVEPSANSIAGFLAFFMQNRTAAAEFSGRLYVHYVTNLQGKFTGKAVAQRILETYEKL